MCEDSDELLSNSLDLPFPFICFATVMLSSLLKCLYLFNHLDANGNPITETIQSVVVTDSSGNAVTGNISPYYIILLIKIHDGIKKI